MSSPDEFPPGPDGFGYRPRSPRSVADLLADLADQTGTLIRQEIALAKAELREALGGLGRGAAAIAIGAFFALCGWLVLLATAVLALAIVLAPWLAALIVAVVMLAIGGVLVYLGKRRLERTSIVPRRTLRSLREDGAWVKEQLS